MTGWVRDKRWSDRYLPEIKPILGAHLISEPPIEEDAERNTDLMVLRMDAVRIACRIRTHEYMERYGDEITIRSGRPSGAKTELAKIIEGWGDYFFYGFADEQEDKLALWILGDLKAFRLYHSRCLATNGGKMPGVQRANYDDSSTFTVFKYKEIPGFIVASSAA